MQIKEAIDLGIIIIENLNSQPQITDFKEEWVLFLTDKDMKEHPEIIPEVNLRIRQTVDDFFKKHQVIYNGWESFLNEINKQYKQKHRV